MDTEMFTNGGYESEDAYGGKMWNPFSYGREFSKATVDFDEKVAKIKLMHATKMFMRAMTVIAVVFLLLKLITQWGPEMKSTIMSWAGKEEQKDGFYQWLGASTNVVRGDYENNQDSLAERAVMNDKRVTDISQPMPVAAPVSSAFTSRERMSTPEEELMKQHASK